MQVRFLLGPAGSGKTYRCLAEIKEALLQSPGGPPLILLAPKQATFQLERQLLADPAIEGYTRLHILSFERLAQYVLDELRIPAPPSLSEQGRVMVLRALLIRRQRELKIFRASARLTGFAQQLSLVLREFQQHRLPPARLTQLAARPGTPAQLRDKLHDLSLLLAAYADWLKAQNLQDANHLLDAATEALQTNIGAWSLELGASNLWLDGFAELTPQELELLAAFIPHCQQATLAFCLPCTASPFSLSSPEGGEGRDEEALGLGTKIPSPQPSPRLGGEREAGVASIRALSWLSPWSIVAQTFNRCRDRLAAVEGCQITIETLANVSGHGRFANSELLGRLEANWSRPNLVGTSRRDVPARAIAGGIPIASGLDAARIAQPTVPTGNTGSSKVSREASPSTFNLQLSTFTCSDPEAEAVLAAREILRHVRDGGRYRDCAVIVRQLDTCHATLARVFRRYEIPFFMDRREPVSHHPLTELTRFALRTIAFGWRHDDWFGALKTGLVPASEGEIDALENEALARGWEGRTWREPLSIADDAPRTDRCEKLRRRLVPPFEKLAAALSGRSGSRRPRTAGEAEPPPTGGQIADAIRDFWAALKIEATLERWTLAEANTASIAYRKSSIHSTVLDQMSAWLDNLALAFAGEALPLREWLPILEAGLVNLTVGVIPPALDQVLVGAIDRSRNPDLKLALVLGLNEGAFPAPPAPGTLLTDADRSTLERAEVFLGPTQLQRLGQERYLGYIACTRSSERLVVTCAARDDEGQPLNPSPFFTRIQEITGVATETFDGTEDWWKSEHACELAAPVLRAVHNSLSIVQDALTPALSRRTGEGEATDISSSSKPCELADVSSDVAKIKSQNSLLALGEIPSLAPLVEKFRELEAAAGINRLPTPLVEQLYGRELHTSVSALEEFAACPFKFFTARGLRVEERKEFQFDDRDKGSFQHEILQEFHQRVQTTGRCWRDLTVDEARELINVIGQEHLLTYGGGRFLANGAARFTGEFLIERLQRLMTAMIQWMRQYEFDPTVVEISFGLDEGGVPPWKFNLPRGRALELRGRIDRVDLYREDKDTALAVVMDYKSTARALNPTKLYHGLELQLLSYLGVLRHLSNPQKFLNIERLIPAGVFYVPLNGATMSAAATRDEALGGDDALRRSAYQHSGRFLGDALKHFDNRGVAAGDQFKYSKNKGGGFSARGNEAVAEADFAALREKVEKHLREYGMRIYAGEVTVAPFRINRDTACDRCDFRPICRFDPWTQPYRLLRPPPRPEKGK